MIRTIKRFRQKYNYRTRKHYGKGVLYSKPSKSKYPPLPESPINRPSLLVNNNNLIPPQRGSKERQNRFNKLLRRITILRKNVPKKISKNSYFKINNAGFKS